MHEWRGIRIDFFWTLMRLRARPWNFGKKRTKRKGLNANQRNQVRDQETEPPKETSSNSLLISQNVNIRKAVVREKNPVRERPEERPKGLGLRIAKRNRLRSRLEKKRKEKKNAKASAKDERVRNAQVLNPRTHGRKGPQRRKRKKGKGRRRRERVSDVLRNLQ